MGKMSRSGASGYYICCIACALLWIYFCLFVLRMCDSEMRQIHAANDMKTKFLKKNKQRNESVDVDAGMIEESQEQRERDVGIGNGDSAYNENSGIKDEEDSYAQQDRKGTFSAYDDDNSNGPSAGTWQDVEE